VGGGGGDDFRKQPTKTRDCLRKWPPPTPPPHQPIWVPLKHIHVGPELSNTCTITKYLDYYLHSLEAQKLKHNIQKTVPLLVLRKKNKQKTN